MFWNVAYWGPSILCDLFIEPLIPKFPIIVLNIAFSGSILVGIGILVGVLQSKLKEKERQKKLSQKLDFVVVVNGDDRTPLLSK